MQVWLIRAAALAALVLAPLAAAQAERITSFESDIAVRADGSMLVTETITVIAQGDRIRRGIFRDFPTMYEGPWGLRAHVPFEVSRVTRAGRDEPHAIETLQNGVRVRIGREEVMLPAGEHTYTITYETANQLGLFEDHDELYWNVTGTGWDFPIDSITARVTLPAPVAAGDLRLEAFTGTQGATGRDFTAGVGDDGVIVFETTKPQVAGGNMTIVAGWPKGIIDEAAAKGRAASLLRANLFVILLGLGVLASFVYLHLQWIRVGRDPERGPLSPRLEPPEGLSPGACRYLHKMRHDDTCFAAALFNLAVTGVLAIRADEDGSYEIERLDPDAKPAFPDEKKIARRIVPDGDDTLALDQKNHEKIGGSIKAQASSLKDDHGHLFSKNRKPLWIGVLIVLVAWIAGVLTLPVFAMAVAGFLTVWLGFWSVACVALVLFVAGAWTTVAREGKASNIAGAVLLSLFAAPFLGFWVFGMTMLAQQTVFWTPFVLGLACILFVVYAILLPAPTVEGRRIMDGIEGFALYLRGGSDPAHRGVSRGIDADEFERWLPYAVALDASENWEAYFGGVVESKLREEDERELAERADRPDWHPVWLHGPHHLLHAGAFTDSISSSLVSAVSSSSTAPGSSSGFSGGGSSGGGGGGGGGGGW
jgi:uncharacterized membrane protein YgcG